MRGATTDASPLINLDKMGGRIPKRCAHFVPEVRRVEALDQNASTANLRDP
jgi:hypothetical protein